MASRIEQIIDEIEDYIDGCKTQAFAPSKIIVNRETMEELLNELRSKTPDEIKRYQKIISNKEAILADAQAKADAIIAQAQVKTDELVSEHEIMQQAYAQANEVVMIATKQAQEILDNATNEANSLRVSAMGYADDQLHEIEAAAKWQDTLDEFGKMKKIEDDTFKVTKSGKTLTTDMTIKFAKKDVNFEVVYDYYSMDVTGISVDPIYTLGEKMEKAGLNTVISMAVVFAVLILISLLISCFKIFPYLEKKKAAKAAGQAPQQEETPAAAPAPAPVAAQTDDTELIAVIAAAIAASTGTSTSDFVVRSINRR